jgi:hypothetical protein
MHRITITVLLLCVISSGASPQTTQRPTPSGLTLKARIPRPKRSVYTAVRDGRDWKNPYLIAVEDGVEVRKSGDDYSAPVVSVAEVVRFLEDLPKSAWPYGLVVAVEEGSVCCRYPDGETKMRANQMDLMRRLKRAGIAVSRWPSG